MLGGGAWGTALALHAARKGHDTLIWALEKEVAEAINTQHENTVFLKAGLERPLPVPGHPGAAPWGLAPTRPAWPPLRLAPLGRLCNALACAAAAPPSPGAGLPAAPHAARLQ